MSPRAIACVIDRMAGLPEGPGQEPCRLQIIFHNKDMHRTTALVKQVMTTSGDVVMTHAVAGIAV